MQKVAPLIILSEFNLAKEPIAVETSLVPRSRPAFRHLQYGKVSIGAWVGLEVGMGLQLTDFKLLLWGMQCVTVPTFVLLRVSI